MNNYNKKIYLFGLFFIALFFLGCRAEKEKSRKVLTYTGCGITKKAFMNEIVVAYNKRTGTKIKISGGGATRGVRFAAAGKTDFGGSCRHKLDLDEEKAAFAHIVAWDALVAIVHPQNPVNGLTAKQLKNILIGKITNWKSVGGKNEKIQVVARTGKISGPGRLAREIIFGDLKLDYAKTTKIFTSSGPMEKAVERKKNSIGITGISSARKRKVKSLKLNNISPSYKNIFSGKYPFFRPLYIFTKGKPVGEKKKFIEYILGEGQEVIKNQGTVNLKDGTSLFSLFAQKMKKVKVPEYLWK